MDELFNLVRREADRVRSTLQTPRQGLITSYDKITHTVRVTLQPEGVETGWLPILSQHIGDGFGIVVGPSVGDQVTLMPSEHDGETHVVVGRMFSDQDKPPQVESGEILIKHKSGAQTKIDKDGNVTTAGPSGNVTTHDKDGAITHQGKGGSTMTMDPKGVAGVTTKSPKNVVNKGEKVIHTGGPEKTGSSQDDKLKSAIKAKAQADLAADPNRQSVNMQTTLPSGAAYSYTVTRS